jgi:hypothetical protein
MFIKLLPIFVLFAACNSNTDQKQDLVKHRILISTDIGGTDPDDNQSMTHLLMYSNLFQIEGLVSSPSYGDGNKEEREGLHPRAIPLLLKALTGL